MAADVVRGVYIDPAAGKVTLRSYADDWLRAQTVDPLTREATTSRLRTHVYPVLGDRELRALRPSTVQAWLSGLTGAASSIRVIYANLSSVLSAAVDDGLIVKNPCRAASVRPPALDRGASFPGPRNGSTPCGRRSRPRAGPWSTRARAAECARARSSA